MEVTAVGGVGVVALHVMGNASLDVLTFASGVNFLCAMSIRLIDVSSAQLNSGIFFAFLPLFSSPFYLVSSLFTASLSPFFHHFLGLPQQPIHSTLGFPHLLRPLPLVSLMLICLQWDKPTKQNKTKQK
jgi:hypothetical protein